jgi:hypothetical protein
MSQSNYRIVQTTWTDGGPHQPLPPPDDPQGDEIERLTKRVAELTATLERGIAVTLHSAVDRGIPIDIACRRLACALRDEYSAPGISRRDIAVVLDVIETPHQPLPPPEDTQGDEIARLTAIVAKLEPMLAYFLYESWSTYPMSTDDYLRHLRIVKTGVPEHKPALIAVREFTKDPRP